MHSLNSDSQGLNIGDDEFSSFFCLFRSSSPFLAGYFTLALLQLLPPLVAQILVLQFILDAGKLFLGTPVEKNLG